MGNFTDVIHKIADKAVQDYKYGDKARKAAKKYTNDLSYSALQDLKGTYQDRIDEARKQAKISLAKLWTHEHIYGLDDDIDIQTKMWNIWFKAFDESGELIKYGDAALANSEY